MKAILKRLREPSSLAGLAVLATLFGAPPGLSEAVVQAVAALAGVGAILVRENGGE